MLKSILMGAFAIAVICWAMGAYNRLVRLRAAIAQALAALQLLSKREPQSPELESEAEDELAGHTPKNQTELTRCKEAYEAAVHHYNVAIGQVPAAWIATLFGFKPIKSDEGKH